MTELYKRIIKKLLVKSGFTKQQKKKKLYKLLYNCRNN